jgi:hypothetical protein
VIATRAVATLTVVAAALSACGSSDSANADRVVRDFQEGLRETRACRFVVPGPRMGLTGRACAEAIRSRRPQLANGAIEVARTYTDSDVERAVVRVGPTAVCLSDTIGWMIHDLDCKRGER